MIPCPSRTAAFSLLACLALSMATLTMPASAHATETQSAKLILPDPLVTADGKKITDTTTWQQIRREEILELFRENIYGRSPGRTERVSYTVTGTNPRALNGKATQKQVTIHLGQGNKALDLELLLYLPNHVKQPVPIFLGLNFGGNHAVIDDTAIPLHTSKWFRNNSKVGYFKNRATEKTRGAMASRWPIEMAIDRGFGVATVYYGDIDPDYDDGFRNGVHGLFTPDNSDSQKTKRAGDAWGSISAWAWGLSRVMDYLETDKAVDPHRVVVFGHSRLGKTALWAGAQDQRFAIVISNESGYCGAALSRAPNETLAMEGLYHIENNPDPNHRSRDPGETLNVFVRYHPYWSCDNCKKFCRKVDELPIDQHMLIALIAPRPVYVASADDTNQWADPKREFLGAKNAEPVYRLFGKWGLLVDQMPPNNRSVGDSIGYHIRDGRHDITAFDWEQYLNFAQRHFDMKK